MGERPFMRVAPASDTYPEGIAVQHPRSGWWFRWECLPAAVRREWFAIGCWQAYWACRPSIETPRKKGTPR